jgi:hypothetical protein
MRSYGEISLKAASEGYVQPCVTMAAFPRTISGDIAADRQNRASMRRSRRTKPESCLPGGVGSLQARAAS